MKKAPGHALKNTVRAKFHPGMEWKTQTATPILFRCCPVEIFQNLLFHGRNVERNVSVPHRTMPEESCGDGISGGYEGTGSKTVIPTKAFAKMSCRLVPGQDPARIQDLCEAHFRKVCPPSVRMKFTRGHIGAAYLSDPHSPYGKAAQQALESTFGNPPVLVREGGSIPIVAEISQRLGKDALFLGLDLPDARIHSPNENMRLDIFEKGITMTATMLRLMARAC